MTISKPFRLFKQEKIIQHTMQKASKPKPAESNQPQSSLPADSHRREGGFRRSATLLGDWLLDQVIAQFQVKPAADMTELGHHIPSQNPLVTQFLNGGIRTGCITEWGIPLGCSGRRVIVDFVSQVTQHQELCLWVNGHADLKIHPPAWVSQGVNPLKWVVADASAPVKQLKSAIMQPIFKLLVLDMATHQLSTEDIAFIGLQARLHRYAVILIRPHLLSNQHGNAWAKYRINVHPQQNHLHLSVVKGLQDRHLTLANYGPIPGTRQHR